MPVLLYVYLFIATHKDESGSCYQVKEGASVGSEDEVQDGSENEIDQHDGYPVKDPLFSVLPCIDSGDEGNKVGDHEGGDEDEEEEN